MKRYLILAFLLISAISVSFSQEETGNTVITTTTTSGGGVGSSFTSKNGYEVLPQEGDYCILVGANTMLRYVGNLFGKTNSNNNVDFFDFPATSLPTAVIGGKYFISGNTAIRAALRVYYNNSTSKAEVDDDLSTDPDDFLYDKVTTKYSGYNIGLGLEKRRGNNRIQGIYGAEIYGFYFNNRANAFEYANAFSQVNQFPSFTDWTSSPSYYTNLPAPVNGYRIKSHTIGDLWGFGASVFVGAEYFFAPKISLGGEFSLGMGYSKTKAETVTYESFDPLNDAVIEYSLKGEGTRSMQVDMFNLGGEINLNIYF